MKSTAEYPNDADGEALRRVAASGADMGETLLGAKRSDGWRFLWPDTRDEISPQEIFEGPHFARMR